LTGIADDTVGRTKIIALLSAITPWDDLEADHVKGVSRWIASGAPLYRNAQADEPPVHLVSYFVALDEVRGELLLVDHRKSGLWLPTGGHVEIGEDPWATVLRECAEELAIAAKPTAIAAEQPFFVTMTPTRGDKQHTDVSLWYIVGTDAGSVTEYDKNEFAAIRWLTVPQVLSLPVATVDPHMHRFVRKLDFAMRRLL
jgi:8-oxo-dGTP pyrophosphatase MutT (NUDIX family)